MNVNQKDVIALVSKVIKVPEDKIDPKANLFTGLGIDSLVGVEIFAALDKKYGVNIPEERLSEVSTISDLVKLVTELSK